MADLTPLSTKLGFHGHRVVAAGTLAAYCGLCIAMAVVPQSSLVIANIDPTQDTIVPSDVAWMLMSTALVWLMTPGLR